MIGPPRLGPRASVQEPGQPSLVVHRGQNAHLVAHAVELVGQSLDMAGDAPGVGPRVRRDQRDAHVLTLPRSAPANRPVAEPSGELGSAPRARERHFVKYTFLKIDPAWRRLGADQRAADKREFIAACEDFAQGHLLRAFSLVGTRGDCDLMLLSQALSLDHLHEFHVVLSQSGLMGWATVPHSFLAMTKPSEYSDESRLEIRPAHGKYLFVYPFVKTRDWYRLPAEERQGIMAEHIRVGREYPEIDLNTSYSFGLDDQEFVVAFETDDPARFLDLVQRLRGTDASAFTLRDTPVLTCISMSVARALNAVDGEALALEPAAAAAS
jgi:chlorite dismutase